MTELKKKMPEGVDYAIAYDPTVFVEKSIDAVIHTLIEALLLAELTGEKPNKRMMELLQLHQMGWASDADLAAGLAREQAARTKRAAAKKSL